MQGKAFLGNASGQTRVAGGGSIFPHGRAVTRLSIYATAIKAAHIGGSTSKDLYGITIR